MRRKAVVAWCIISLSATMPLVADEPGGATPEEVFKQYQAALIAEKYADACKLTTPESQVALIADMMSFAFLETTAGPSGMQAILDKHGLSLKDALADEGRNSRTLIMGVKDKPQCWHECMTYISAKANGAADSSVAKNHPVASVTLTDLQVQQNSAKATQKAKLAEQEVSETIYFKRIGERWYLDFYESARQQRKHVRQADAPTTEQVE